MIEARDPPQTSRLKCLDCGWKWWSRCRYVDRLDFHVERIRSGMIDEDVLERIEEGSLWVNIIRGDVVSGSRQGTVILQPIEHESNGSTYHFVKICYQGKQKKIAVHRLVWMFVHRRVPPPGFDVHHKRGKGVAFPNGIDNLQLIESAINRSSTQIEEVPF